MHIFFDVTYFFFYYYFLSSSLMAREIHLKDE